MTFKKHFKNTFVFEMMFPNNLHNNILNNFSVVGVNYRKSDMSVRGKFSLSSGQTIVLLRQAVANKFPGCMVLSTCNRTEIYGICSNPDDLIQLLCMHTHGNMKDFFEYGYTFQSVTAVEHLFKVASGLDSQIIGDFEILSQLKHAAKVAKENRSLNSLMERIINFALQASKEIKTKTKISSGTVSVAYAAIEIIKKEITDLDNKKVLLVGTGKFGNDVAKNLKDYLPSLATSFANRTDEKAYILAGKYDGSFVSYNNLSAVSDNFNVIIVSSSADDYTILRTYFTPGKPHLILDLSMPQNVDPEVKNIAGISLLNVDEVSLILDKTISIRQAQIPKAMNIIDETLNELLEWYRNQFNNPFLRKVKSQLQQLSKMYFFEKNEDEKIQKIISALAVDLKHKKNKGCQCINALNKYFEMHYETTS